VKTCVDLHANLIATKVRINHRKLSQVNASARNGLAKRNNKKTRVLSLRLLASPFGQGLRTVPTNCKGFYARLRPRGKSRSLQGLLESTKKNGGSHAFFRDN